MMGWLKSLFGANAKTRVARESQDSEQEPMAMPVLRWKANTTMPIPDWGSLDEPATQDAAALDRYWTAVAIGWLQALSKKLGPRYRTSHSPHFRLLSTLDEGRAKRLLEYCERALRRILRVLDGIASSEGYGPHVVLIFDTRGEYNKYIANYYAEMSEFAQSSGMFIDAGYGHLAFAAKEADAMNLNIIHKLTLCLVSHLPIPEWLNEGMASKMEKVFFPVLGMPSSQLYTPKEVDAQHAAYWNPATIQAYWSGKAYFDDGEASELAYDLGERMTNVLAQDEAAFRAFANAASADDGGAEAAERVLGIRLGDLAAAILGPGDWEPASNFRIANDDDAHT